MTRIKLLSVIASGLLIWALVLPVPALLAQEQQGNGNEGGGDEAPPPPPPESPAPAAPAPAAPAPANGPIVGTYGSSPTPLVLGAYIYPGMSDALASPGSPTPTVHGATASPANTPGCEAPFHDFMMAGYGDTPSTEQVTTLQIFLNRYQNARLSVTGVYDTATQETVRLFQLAHREQVLEPWPTEPNGNFYLLTRWWANMEYCKSYGVDLNIPRPDMVVWQGPR